jgi:hypothetical protein
MVNPTLDAIMKSNTIFVSAQPDHIYFHWQVELYMYQFAKYGFVDQCYALFGYTGDAPSNYAVELSKRYNIFFYKDTRNMGVPHYYIPSIRPHILKQFFQQFPQLGKSVFYHDSDILFQSLPKFELMLNDNIAYLSDTASYINYSYIKTCAERYKEKYPELKNNHILTKMCECMNISEDLVKANDLKSGGAQYLLKGVSYDYWNNVENGVNKLFPLLKEYEIKYPIHHHIQSWTADMWVVLWEYWKLGKETAIHNELRFSWATDHISQYFANPIFHLAGITDADASTAFYKGKYKDSNIFYEYLLDRTIFNHVLPTSATYEYVKLIKEYVNSDEFIYTKSFIILTKDTFGGLYKEDHTTIHFKKAVWRSNTGNHMIFFNGSSWILIACEKEPEISSTLVGINSNSATYPYLGEWAIPCKILMG